MATDGIDDLEVRRADGARLDLGRPVEALLGLPFDALSLDEAVAEVRRCARERRPCFLSTPNVNFAVAAQDDQAFRASVLHSDLSLADGMPIVWAARLLGSRLPERVSGSDLFARLQREPGEPLKVYFFGGPDGVAERAAAALDTRGGGLRCVGFDSPGFGSVEAMSGEERIARINGSGADFLVVSLGARKGQAWIERNRARLAPPVISHLGAVVNFVAGELRRSPPARSASASSGCGASRRSRPCGGAMPATAWRCCGCSGARSRQRGGLRPLPTRTCPPRCRSSGEAASRCCTSVATGRAKLRLAWPPRRRVRCAPAHRCRSTPAPRPTSTVASSRCSC